MIDTTAIRAEWEPRRRASIYGVEFENGDAATVLAMCDEIDALRRANELRAESDNAHIARLQDEIVAARARAESVERSLIATVRRYTADWQLAEDALVAAGVEMFEHGDRLTIEDGIARLAKERDKYRNEYAEADYELVHQRGADGLVVATLMDMTGARNRDDLVRVVGQMMRAAREAPKG